MCVGGGAGVQVGAGPGCFSPVDRSRDLAGAAAAHCGACFLPVCLLCARPAAQPMPRGAPLVLMRITRLHTCVPFLHRFPASGANSNPRS